MSAESQLDHDVYQLIAMNGEQYAVPVHCITTVLALENVLPLPDTPQWVSGVAHIRNAIVPVVNLNKLIAVGDPALQSDYRLLVMLHHPKDSQRWLALCATDLISLIDKKQLVEMSSSTTTHHCLINIVDNDSQKIHLLDIVNLFEQLQEQD